MGQIKLKNFYKSYGSTEILKDINLEIENGELVVFVGPSGCGKSTLLRLIAGLETPTKGTIEIDGNVVNTVSAADRGLAMVFQSYALYPHMTVRQNLAFGLENAKLPKPEINKLITDASTMLEIDKLLDRRPGQLSGGQRQRVAIGRAIVRRPTAFLLDEPLSNLDAELRGTMRSELGALHKRLASTMVYVTHDQIEAMTLADRIVVLRDGRIEQIDTPLNLFNKPGNVFVAGFIGAPKMNLWEASIEQANEAATVVRVADNLLEMEPVAVQAGEKVTLGVRPQDLRVVDPAQSRIKAEVTMVEALGTETVVHAKLGDGQSVLVVITGQAYHKVGDQIGLCFENKDKHLFNASGIRV